MLDLYWLIENKVAGSAQPQTEADFQAWRDRAIQAVVSLIEHDLRFEGFDVLHLPVPDGTAPSMTQLTQACAFINAQVVEGRPTVVHCHAGRGRTGTVLAAWLISHGATASDAIEHVRRCAPGSIETPAQEQALATFQDHVPQF